MVIEGEVAVNNQVLNKRDAIEIMAADEIQIDILSDAELLAIEVPMD